MEPQAPTMMNGSRSFRNLSYNAYTKYLVVLRVVNLLYLLLFETLFALTLSYILCFNLLREINNYENE
jgi:hypothetical protein